MSDSHRTLVLSYVGISHADPLYPVRHAMQENMNYNT